MRERREALAQAKDKKEKAHVENIPLPFFYRLVGWLLTHRD
jgi:hypothetical protein